MDRRSFIKTIFSLPVIVPWGGINSPHAENFDLFLIADNPEIYLPEILAFLKPGMSGSAQSLTFLSPHPKRESLGTALIKKGWSIAARNALPNLFLSFSTLHRPSPCSFTLMENHKIRDIRTPHLLSLWQKMQKSNSLASLMTRATWKNRLAFSTAGHSLAVFFKGKKIEIFPLQDNFENTFRLEGRDIVVSVDSGKAKVLASSCQQKICVHSSPISLVGERILCVPNRFYIEVEGFRFFDTVIG